MGRDNRQRRADKKRRQRHEPGSPGRGGPSRGWGQPGGWDPATDPGWLILAATAAVAVGEEEAAARNLGALAALPATVAEEAVVDRVAEVLTAVLEGGWQPSEVVRAVRRSAAATHADALVTALAVDRWRRPGTTAPAAWQAQLGRLGVERWWGNGDGWLRPWSRRADQAWRAALQIAAELLASLEALARIGAVVPPPSAWGERADGPAAPVDDGVMAKIRALLAKAESTAFEAEASALTAKAQELMARHAVDEAVARSDGRREEAPVLRRIAVDDPYAAAKEALLDVVGDANGVRSVSYGAVGLVGLVGFPADLDAVETLFTSLLVQATRGMVERGSVTDGRGRSRTRSYRQSFLLAYASRIRERLHAAASVAHSEAETAFGRSMLPVLAARDGDVEAAVSDFFPSLATRRGPRATNPEGWRHGRVAGELATLGEERSVLV